MLLNVDYFGPELPPNLSCQVEIGPQLPNHFKARADNEENDEDMEEFMKQITAQIPKDKDDEDAGMYGPMPCTDSDEIRKEFVIKEIEGRAAKTKQLLLGGKVISLFYIYVICMSNFRSELTFFKILYCKLIVF